MGIFEAMDGLPVTVRLLDPPLHEFLPNHVDLAVAVAVAEERGDAEVVVRDEKWPLDEAKETLRKVEELHEDNPMLGLRGVRLGIVKPGLYAMQVRAIVEAACDRKEAGGNPVVEIMIPLTATREEMRQMREELEPAAADVQARRGVEVDVALGHDDRAAARGAGGRRHRRGRRLLLVRDERPDADGVRLQPRRHRQVPGSVRGAKAPAGQPVRDDRPAGNRAADADRGRGGHGPPSPDLHLGICGEHGGDPDSVVFCHEIGLDYVSCSPFRVETARLAAGQAALGSSESASK